MFGVSRRNRARSRLAERPFQDQDRALTLRGIPLTGSRLAERYAAIGAGFDAGDADVVCCQEVFTYWHLRRLVRGMRSFRWVSWRPGPFGPAGGLVTFSRRPASGTAFRRFGRAPRAPGVPLRSRLQARPRAVVCGDFNVSRESALFGEFMAATGLADAFAGACPATFRAEYLPAGATAHCIDFILTADEVTAESTGLVFAETKKPLGYVSDHIGLRARLSLTPTAVRVTPRPGA
jgi:sphingomyelin phosphodiesterase 2